VTKQTAGPISQGMKRLSRLDIPGGGQIVVRGRHAFVGHLNPPYGTSIVDVGDPNSPRLVSQIMLADNRSHTHKVRVTGDLMVCNHEMHDRHFLRKGFDIPDIVGRFKADLGREPTDAEIAAQLQAPVERVGELREVARTGYADGGFKVYDISDPANPELISYQHTGGVGVHRFDVCDRYAYISTEMEGFHGNILVIYDLSRPDRIEEVSRWWLPGQHVAGGETPTWQGLRNKLHHTLRHGNELWAACWYAGGRIVDVTDISRPHTVGSFSYHPPYPEPTHTFMKVPHKIDGMDIAVIADEEHPHDNGQPHAFLWVLDVSDYANIKALAQYHVTDFDAPWARAHLGRDGSYRRDVYGPGLHQFQEHIGPDNLLYCAWFSAGLRVIDISNPHKPKEVAHFIPEPAKGCPAPQTNDVDVDGNGLVYLIDRENGLDILEMS
jgi:hypothetical protein